jgi:hypothetical protein
MERKRIAPVALTFEEIRERLKQFDETILCEVLDISSEDLVERFADRIEIRLNELEEDLEDDYIEET